MIASAFPGKEKSRVWFYKRIEVFPIPDEVKIKIQVYFKTKKQPIKVQISISKKKSFPIRKSLQKCKS
ncbi:hypothetical protein H8959_004408 [Pygathrix nigripes]